MKVSGKMLNLAKSKLASLYNVDERSLVYVFSWEFEFEQLLSFEVKQPGHPHHGSTLSFKIPKKKSVS